MGTMKSEYFSVVLVDEVDNDFDPGVLFLGAAFGYH